MQPAAHGCHWQPSVLQACWDDNFNGRHLFNQTDFLHSPLLDELKALETRVLAEFAVNVPSALVVDRCAVMCLSLMLRIPRLLLLYILNGRFGSNGPC